MPVYEGLVQIPLWDGIVEEVWCDEKTGPKVLRMDGNYIDFRCGVNMPWRLEASENHYGPTWPELSSTHQTIIMQLVAKSNRKLKERMRWL
mmetsp:Transcript_66062/g.153442  ORF Transcript_66062/g.153442 Transcript_66062/m.153442 type:complete len:91 (-) Transcript_66062:64-336(-)|eukprot:CAMPEP_0171056958 /NCGR_PEP_ID=MMETSP0766_2-20121228/1462_1 /TAXON_ID=439317 /ORGANISM="Gambierdiscus australes, Strain CAWD 149" /LENGTH=90 /DNA_ID=CAMNT_0011511977 /DNA_START=83 /DNA_END=355 /DNA_ORIENTATION=+